MAKVEATRAYGGQVELAGSGFEGAVSAAQEHVDRAGATSVHAFEDARVIAGQGTIGLELAEQARDAATVLIPVGGGGLAAGISLALRERRPGQRIVGVVCQPGLTIADGISVKSRGELPGAILDRTLDDVVEVTDEEISDALVLCLERKKLLVEGAGAVGLAAVLNGRAGGDDPVAIVLSGGNIDATTLISVMRLGLTRSGRYLAMRMLIPDRPGELGNVLGLVARERGNLVSVDHHREGTTRTALQTEVELVVSTRDEAHCGEILVGPAQCRLHGRAPRPTRITSPRRRSSSSPAVGKPAHSRRRFRSRFVANAMSATDMAKGQTLVTTSTTAAAELDRRLAGLSPGVDPAVDDRARVVAPSGEDARCDRGARPGLADRDE